jgi:hypothetical protein
MKRYLIASFLVSAIPSLAHAKVMLPVIGWTVSPGHSTTGSNICTLFGGFGEHSDLAWVADAASPPQHFTLVFDDGGVPPRSKTSESRLTVSAPGSPPMSLSGTIRFGQFRTDLDRQDLQNLLHLFAVNRSMTVALEGQSPVLVNLTGSADAAQNMKHCETVENIPARPEDPVRVAATTRHHSAAEAAVATPVPSPMPAKPALPALAPAAAAPIPIVAAAIPLPTPTPAARLAMSDSLLLAKAIEGQFLDILQDGRASYQNTGDEPLSQGARATRAADLCTLLGNDKEVVDWAGTIAAVSSNSQGGTRLAVKLADGITIGTMDSGSATSTDGSAIDPTSDLIQTFSRMHVGEPVTFSGTFFASETDCIKETSLTQNRSMTSPNFLFEFTVIERTDKSPASQAKP